MQPEHVHVHVNVKVAIVGGILFRIRKQDVEGEVWRMTTRVQTG